MRLFSITNIACYLLSIAIYIEMPLFATTTSMSQEKNQIVSLNHKIDDQNETIENLTAELNRLKEVDETLEATKESLSAAESTIAKNSKEIETLKEEINNKNSLLQQHKKSAEEAIKSNQNINDINNAYKQFLKYRNTTEMELKQLEVSLEKTTQLLKEAQTENEKLKKDKIQLEQKSKKAFDKIKDLERKVKNTQKSFNKKIQVYKKSYQELYKDTDNKIQNLQQTINDKNFHIKTLEENLDSLYSSDTSLPTPKTVSFIANVNTKDTGGSSLHDQISQASQGNNHDNDIDSSDSFSNEDDEIVDSDTSIFSNPWNVGTDEESEENESVTSSARSFNMNINQEKEADLLPDDILNASSSIDNSQSDKTQSVDMDMSPIDPVSIVPSDKSKDYDAMKAYYLRIIYMLSFALTMSSMFNLWWLYTAKYNNASRKKKNGYSSRNTSKKPKHVYTTFTV